jgi:hypothetical protein
MLLAVMMGLEQLRRSVLHKRRRMRRLLLAGFSCMLFLTRNPSVPGVLEKVDTPLNPTNAERFRVFHDRLWGVPRLPQPGDEA